MNVPFIQFMRPFGNQVPIEIDLPDDLADKVKEIHDCGCRFTAEVLMNGACSFCIECPEAEGDFDIALSANGPQVPIRIADMIRRFSVIQFEQWKKDMLQ